MLKRILVLLSLVLTACSGGGGGNKLSSDSCSVLGLPALNAKIVNGTACGNLNDSPVVRVVIESQRLGKTFFCTGTMITSQDVLTAAHCFDQFPSSVILRYGPASAVVDVSATTVFIDPDYVKIGVQSPEVTFYDVAVMHLSRSVPLPALPVLGSRTVGAGEIVSIFGYGSDGSGPFDGVDLKSGEMRVDSVTDTHILSVYNGDGSNTCSGDSGGPLITSEGGVPVLTGLTATGTVENCAKGDHSWFTRLDLARVKDFIKSVAPGAGII